MRNLGMICSLLALLAGCASVSVESNPGTQPSPAPETPVSANQSSFAQVVQRMEPVIESECRRRSPGADCDYLILVDDTPGAPANAYQTRNKAGRPVIAFTVALIEDAQNADELAFVLGHEAAHHIRGHLDRQAINTNLGAAVLSGLAGVAGLGGGGQQIAGQIGAAVGSRGFSKRYELEADELGAILTRNAGYDALRGAQFFRRIPDPGNQFLGSHPPNAERLERVRQALARG